MGYKLETVNDTSNCWINIIYLLGIIIIYIIIFKFLKSLLNLDSKKRKRLNPNSKVRCPYNKMFDSPLITSIE